MSPSISVRLLATQSDQRLLDLVRKGHERAFEAIVNRYRRPLLAYCRRLGLADSRAEDVLQQALLKAWLALQAGSEVRELRPWLYRIVHNTAVNAIRSSPERRGLIVDGAPPEHAAGESELERRIAARDALTDVAALPPMQRDAILLSAVDGRSHEEVASALGISNGAVRGLIYRARATLRGAAAALTPQPLVAWAAGSASRVGPSAGPLAEFTAGGGGDATGMAIKGAALAVSAALAAGAVLGPLHPQGSHGRRPAGLPGAGISAEAGGPAPGGATLQHVSGGPAGPSQSVLEAAALKRVAALAHEGPAAQHRGGLRHVSALAPPSVPALRTPRSTDGPHGGSGVSGGSQGSPRSGSGDLGSSGPAAPVQAPQSGGEKDGSESESDKAQREAEEAQQRAQQEAEAARETKEREAEEARQLSEREAEAKQTSTTTADH